METLGQFLLWSCIALSVALLWVGVLWFEARGSARLWEGLCDEQRAAHRASWNELWEKLMTAQTRNGELKRQRDHLRERLTRTGTARTAAEKRVAELLDSLQKALHEREAAERREDAILQGIHDTFHRRTADPRQHIPSPRREASLESQSQSQTEAAIPLGTLVDHIIWETGPKSGKTSTPVQPKPNPPTPESCSNS